MDVGCWQLGLVKGFYNMWEKICPLAPPCHDALQLEEKELKQ